MLIKAYGPSFGLVKNSCVFVNNFWLGMSFCCQFKIHFCCPNPDNIVCGSNLDVLSKPLSIHSGLLLNPHFLLHQIRSPKNTTSKSSQITFFLWPIQAFCCKKSHHVLLNEPTNHGSLNVPIEHHPTMRCIIYNGH